MRAGIVLSNARENRERSFRAGFKERGVTDQSNALQFSGGIAAIIKRAAIERADQTVIPYQSRHDDGM